MYLLFVKLHLIIFEIISFVLFCCVFGALFYYSVIYKNMKAMTDEKNIESLNITFSANYSEGVFSDIDLRLYEENANNETGNKIKACILYTKTYYDYCKGNTKLIIEEINKVNPYNIFLFENQILAENFKHRLLNLKTESSTFNLTLFGLISLFLIFIKITLLKDSIIRLKKIKSSKSDGKNEVYTNLLAQIHPEEFALSLSGKEENKNLYYNPVLSFLNPINVYYYIIFNLTIVIIIPLIFPNYIEYYIVSYFGPAATGPAGQPFRVSVESGAVFCRSVCGPDFPAAGYGNRYHCVCADAGHVCTGRNPQNADFVSGRPWRTDLRSGHDGALPPGPYLSLAGSVEGRPGRRLPDDPVPDGHRQRWADGASLGSGLQ